MCHWSFCSWESHNGPWLTPALGLASPCLTCRGGLELIKDLGKTGIVFLVNCDKFRRRPIIPDMSTKIPESWIYCLTLPPLPSPQRSFDHPVSVDTLRAEALRETHRKASPGGSGLDHPKRRIQSSSYWVNSVSSSGKWKNVLAGVGPLPAHRSMILKYCSLKHY